MYKDETNVINIQASQLINIGNQIQSGCLAMQAYAESEISDKESLKAYIASIDILMTSLGSQSVLLQQALDKLAEELKN